MLTKQFLMCMAAAGVLALGGCERSPQTTKLDGTWAWSTTMNCYGNENTISFAGSRIQVYLHGDLIVSVANALIDQEELTDGRLVLVVRYTLQNKKFEERYLLVNDNTLKPLKTEVDGKSQVSAAGKDKLLVRCPKIDAAEKSSQPQG